MRHLSSAVTLLLTLVVAPAPQRFEPFVPIGVWYDARDRTATVVLRDLQTIRSLGFNHIEVPVSWASTEPQRGSYRFEALDDLLTLAGQRDLKVMVDPQIDPAPPWVENPAADSRLVLAFVDAVSSHAARHAAFHNADPRLSAFSASVAARPPASSSPSGVTWRLDAIRSAAGDRGWKVGQLTVTPEATGADLQLWGWAALAHGARAVTYFSWYPTASRAGTVSGGLVDSEGTPVPRARSAGEFAGIVSRNATLFAPLRPRASRVALVYNPLWDAMPIASAALAQHAMLAFYARTFEHNIQADIIFPGVIAAGMASRYAAVFAGSRPLLPSSVRDALDVYEQAGGRVIADPGADLSVQHALHQGVRVESGGGSVQARFLESADALVLIAINHAASARTVTFRFTPEIPEAIWQNMESGASISFVQGPDGLTYKHAFAPRDALVLAIRRLPR